MSKVTQEKVDEIARLTTQGKTVREIAEIVGLSKTTVAKTRREMRVTKHDVEIPSVEVWEQEVQLSDDELREWSRAALIKHARRIESLLDQATGHLEISMREDHPQAVRDRTWTVGVLSDKLMALAKMARETGTVSKTKVTRPAKKPIPIRAVS